MWAKFWNQPNMLIPAMMLWNTCNILFNTNHQKSMIKGTKSIHATWSTLCWLADNVFWIAASFSIIAFTHKRPRHFWWDCKFTCNNIMYHTTERHRQVLILPTRSESSCLLAFCFLTFMDLTIANDFFCQAVAPKCLSCALGTDSSGSNSSNCAMGHGHTQQCKATHGSHIHSMAIGEMLTSLIGTLTYNHTIRYCWQQKKPQLWGERKQIQSYRKSQLLIGIQRVY